MGSGLPLLQRDVRPGSLLRSDRPKLLGELDGAVVLDHPAPVFPQSDGLPDLQASRQGGEGYRSDCPQVQTDDHGRRLKRETQAMESKGG